MGYVVQDTMSYESEANNSRTLNSSFMPHATRPVLCTYVIEISVSSTLVLTEDGYVSLLSDSSSDPVTERSRAGNGYASTVIAATSIVRCELTHLVQAGNYVKLVTNGSGNFSIVAQNEIIL